LRLLIRIVTPPVSGGLSGVRPFAPDTASPDGTRWQ
jgi:hypothetical protein